MKAICIGAFALVLSGCSIFSGNGERAAMAAPDYAGRTNGAKARISSREAITPAYATGRPVALIPCRGEFRIDGDCRALNDRHQAVEDRAPAGSEADLSAELLVPASE